MKLSILPLLLVLVNIYAVSSTDLASSEQQKLQNDEDGRFFNRSSFPVGFFFGTASSAYQYEGAAREDGKGPSIWDTLTHKHPELIADRSNGDVAVDSYHRYKEDINIMKAMNVDVYRFSISWARIIPNGNLSSGVNRKGINYYNNLINELIAKGVQPFVTLFHWDSPQGLEDAYGGFLSERIVNDFTNYAEVCFREFGDRVKHWITFNEPWSYALTGYPSGNSSGTPQKCYPWASGKCRAADLGTNPYIIVHNQLLAHASVVALYREKFQAKQKGKLGIALNTHWFIPYSKSKVDAEAAQRSLDFMFGWLMDPLTRGNYPLSIQENVGSRLPKFTVSQSKMIRGSFDFIGINYYTTLYAYNSLTSKNSKPSFYTDQNVIQTGLKNGKPIGPRAASEWLFVYPPGLRKLLLYIKNKYNNPVIYITENGIDEFNNKTLSLKEALIDNERISYYKQHLWYLQQSIREGADVRGYFAWSLLDNFEWGSGFTLRFGINYVDYNNNLRRYPKKSAVWFRKFLKR